MYASNASNEGNVLRGGVFVERYLELVVVALHVYGVAGVHVVHADFRQRVAALDNDRQFHGVVLVADSVKQPLVAAGEHGFAHKRHDDGV